MLKRILFFLVFFLNSYLTYADTNSSSQDMSRQLQSLKSQLNKLEIRLASSENFSNTSTSTEAKTNKPIITPKNKKKSSTQIIASTENVSSPVNYIPRYGWYSTDISLLLVGGASAGLSKPSGNSGSFNILDFNPILLFSYKDLLFLRSSVDFSLDDHGNTSVSLDYSNLNLFLNDYAVFAVGKFDSSIGYFTQNLSPAWINRMPDAPVGFDADQAAPQAEVGIHLQGAFPVLSDKRINYILFMANGNQALVNTTTSLIDHIGSDGYTNNYGNYMYGGRLGFLPIPKLEIGISASRGKIALFNLADGTTLLQNSRVYSAFGADFSYKLDDWDLRAEYIQQLISSETGSIVPQGQKWKAWYGQIAYWIPRTNWEPVLRYGKFTAPVASNDQRQWAFGLDYWFAPSVVIQASYELNKGQENSSTDDNQFLIQLAFGF